MEETRGEFTRVISEQYNEYCKLKGVYPTTDGFAAYLVNRTIITDLTIKRFLVIDKYPIALSDHLGIKKAAIWQITEDVNMSFESIKLIIKRFSTAFRIKKLVVPTSYPNNKEQ